MSVKGMPQKRFRYFIETETEDIELQTDPKGWDGHEVGFQRSDDFGLNVENVVPLSFSGIGRKKLKQAYNQKSLFAKTKTRIERRKSDWTYEPYYTYKHDYSKFKDNGKFVEISGLEDGLAKKFETYKDTEFEVTLNVDSNTEYVNYTGGSVIRNNQIQCGAGRMRQKDGLFSYGFVSLGTRAVRSYSDSIVFTDQNGLPYETMTFRAIKNTSFTMKANLVVQISAHASFLQPEPASGKLCIVKHDSSYNRIATIAQYSAYKTKVRSGNNRYDWFNNVEDITISINDGEYISIVYDADNVAYGGDVYVDDGGECYISISNLVESQYINSKLVCFSFEWLISELLKAIDSTSNFASNIEYLNVKPLLSATSCIKSISDSTQTSFIIRAKLSDVLTAYNVLNCVGYDITGQTLTAYNRHEMYDEGNSYGEIKCNNIEIQHDIKHQYSKITVGADTDDRDDDEPLYYPFICKKSFKVSDTIADNELVLMCPFMIDPTQIDRYIEKTNTEADNKDECKFVVFAVGENNRTKKSIVTGQSDSTTGQYSSYTKYTGYVQGGGTIPSGLKINLTPNDISSIYQQNKVVRYYSDSVGISKILLNLNCKKNLMSTVFNYSLYKNGVLFASDISDVDDPYNTFNRSAEFNVQLNINDYIDLEISVKTGSVNDTFYIDYLFFSVDREFIGEYEIYRNHVINNFMGDADTTYNLPFTPKRILNKHKRYLAISTYGSDTKKIEFVSSSILNSNITSKLDYETEYITEDEDFDISETTPLFYPITISCGSIEKLVDIDAFNSKKYRYLTTTDEKTGEKYKFCINSITFGVAKLEEKNIEGQLIFDKQVDIITFEQSSSDYVCSLISVQDNITFTSALTDYVCVLQLV